MRHFSIHGVVGLTVRSHVGPGALAHLDGQLAPFRVPALDAPADISVDIVSSVTSARGARRFGAVAVGANHVSWAHRSKVARWHVALEGLERPPFHLSFSGNRFSYRSLFFHVLQPLVDYHLGLNGMALVHASAVGTEQSALAFSSLSGVGKTSLAILLLSMGLPQFLGDEFIIVSADGTARSFPLPLSLFHRNLVSTPSLRRRLTTRARASLTMNRVLSAVTRAMVRPRLPMGVAEIFPEVTVPRTLPLGALGYLVPTPARDISIRPRPVSAEFVERLLANNHLEFRYFRRVLRAVAAARPDSPVAAHDTRIRKVLSDALSRTPCFEIAVPRRRRLESHLSGAAMRRVLDDATSCAV